MLFYVYIANLYLCRIRRRYSNPYTGLQVCAGSRCFLGISDRLLGFNAIHDKRDINRVARVVRYRQIPLPRCASDDKGATSAATMKTALIFQETRLRTVTIGITPSPTRLADLAGSEA